MLAEGCSDDVSRDPHLLTPLQSTALHIREVMFRATGVSSPALPRPFSTCSRLSIIRLVDVAVCSDSRFWTQWLGFTPYLILETLRLKWVNDSQPERKARQAVVVGRAKKRQRANRAPLSLIDTPAIVVHHSKSSTCLEIPA